MFIAEDFAVLLVELVPSGEQVGCQVFCNMNLFCKAGSCIFVCIVSVILLNAWNEIVDIFGTGI